MEPEVAEKKKKKKKSKTKERETEVETPAEEPAPEPVKISAADVANMATDALKEQEEIKKRKMIEKSINELLDSVERKREELVNKENVLKELKMIQAREKEDLEEEFLMRQRQLEETQNADAERITEERGKLRSELESLETQLEELMSKGRENDEQTLPCPECPVCLELLLPPMRIMQCSNGHLVCGTCEAKVELTCCPTCRQVSLCMQWDQFLYCVHPASVLQGFTGRATAMEQHLATLFT